MPCSHPGKVKYGGNTACVEVRTRSNDVIILDAGTGVRGLGVKIMEGAEPGAELERNVEFMVEGMMKELTENRSEGLRALEGSKPYKKEMHLFLSHFHWDHIQGFPFFLPAYIPGYTLNIYGQLKADHRLPDVFEGQQGKTYFPVGLDMMKAERRFFEILEDTVRINDTIITSRRLTHPQGCLGYRITCGEMTVAYCTDNEHPADGTISTSMLELAENADILIYDCQYTPEEYPMKRNWGHSTWEEGLRVAQEAGAKKLVMFHHDPVHDDAFIDKMVSVARERFPNTVAANEGLVLTDFPCEPTMGPEDDREAELEDAKQPPSLHASGALALVRVGPTFAALNSPEFHKQFAAALDAGAKLIRVDCSQTVYRSRHGFIALAGMAGEAAKRQASLEVIAPKPQIERLLKMARFDVTIRKKL